MAGRVEALKRWFAARDRELLILVLITLAGFVARWILAVGYMLGDDISYTDLIRGVLAGHWMRVEPIGQYAYRPMWVYPLAATVKLFGWGPRGLVCYPMVTGSLIPLLTALWIRRHLPRGSFAPVLCAAILVVYPTLLIDSLMLVNELPMVCWCLVCVNAFGVAFGHLVQTPRVTRRSWRLGLWSLLAGVAFAAAYQVKSAAIPVLGLWLVADLLLGVRRHGWPKLVPLLFAAEIFLLPAIAVQAYYYGQIGQPLGNFSGEMRLYDMNLPPEYFVGKLDNQTILNEYPQQLFKSDGYDGYRIFLHGFWPFAFVGLGALAILGWRKISADYRVLAGTLILVTLGVFLFFQYWPARLKPYYIPNCFTGRPWRYMDVLGPTIAAVIAILLSLPGLFDRRFFQGLRIAVLAVCFGAAGYCIMVRGFEFHDRAAEFRHMAADRDVLKPYWNVPHYTDSDGYGAVRAALGFPDELNIFGRGSGSERIVVDFRHTRSGCVWTGGNRHYGVNADDAWSPGRIQVIGGSLHLVRTWPSELRPWRLYALQLWAYDPAPPSIHDDPPPH